ncbi:MAG: SDR family NAD(P)-dependent oxidoreductase, partial [Gammaproteobacteria bacterium]
GLLFAREIARQLSSATLVLTGRSPLDADVEARLAAVPAGGRNPAGLRIDYRQLDIADAAGVEALVGSILQRHGRLDGVLHAAGVLRDNFILAKPASELAEVFAPKVAGLRNLQRATAAIALDFMALFSSIASAIGNAGQADYAMANAWLDGAAHADARRRTVSINWPLWQEGGMVIDAQTEQWMIDNTGMVQLRSADALDAFYRILASGAPQAMVLQGDAGRIRQWLPGLADEPADDAPVPAPADPTPIVEQDKMSQPASSKADPARRFNEVLGLLRPVAARILKISENELDLDKELISYGFDSISLTEFTNGVNKQYKIASSRALNPTVFFEQPTLRSFATYLAQEYPEVAASAPAQAPAPVPAPAPAAAPVPVHVPAAPAARPVAIARAPQAAPAREPIAVVGMSGRFPMARDLAEYWSNLVQGRDCISEVPAGRWDWRAIFGDPTKEGNRTDVKWGGFIEGVDEFDPLFFGISPREALYMDPMQRLLMQHTWHAIEDAGYSARAISGTRTAIIVGTSVSEYATMLTQAGVPNDAFLPTGRSASLGANRMSYLLNLSGPSETVDTACSSSLVAIHRAVTAIDNADADMALVGGVNILIAPDGHVSFRKAGMLSEDGRCKTFASSANGYARGEGAGMLFLKRLSDAERDGDHIYGLVRASGENHGGRATSLTAPNPKAQAELLKTVYTKAGIDPRTVGFVEAHGTGTPLGDPVEVNALKMAFRDLYQANGIAAADAHCGIGSAKSNIGHLELAAGVAGAIKVLLQLKHRTLVKSLHSEELNPYIQLQGTPFYVVRETAPWAAPREADGREAPRRAGVSSFGFGGANAHVVFEEYTGGAVSAPSQPDGQPRLVVLSARTEARLRDAATQLLSALERDDADLDRIAYTLQVGREAFDERLAMQATSVPQLRERLGQFLAGASAPELHRARVARQDTALAMLDGDELRAAVASWVAKGQLDKLLALWVRGSEIDWRVLYAGRAALPQRVSLPGYPFARERHWPQAVVANVPAPAPAARTPVYLRKTWSASTAAPSAREHVGQALILASDRTMALARLVAAQVRGRIVNLLDAVARPGEFDADGGCIDLSGCAQDGPSLLAVLPWLQHLAARAQQAAPMLLLGVSRGLEACGNAPSSLAGAAHAGLFRMLQSEVARLRSRHLDLDPLEGDEAAAQRIAAEWARGGDEVEACYRNGQRHVSQLAEITLAPSSASLTFGPEQVLWISGGTRGIGLLCARHFVARHGVRKLVLTGREALPPRSQWDAAQGAMAERIAGLRALENAGVQVETLALAGADSAAVQAQVERIAATLGPIAGVLHCAGLNDFDNPAFVRKSAAGFAAVLEPKVAGLDALLGAMRAQPLRFFALFSSVAAAVPSLGAGQSDYVAANAYMDYVAQANANSLPIVSIQWPSWKETGMGEATTRAYRLTGMLSHLDAEGLELLDSVLASRTGPVILPAIVDRAAWQPQRLMLRTLETAAAAPAVPAPVVAAPAVASSDLAGATLAWLAAMFAKELMVPADAIERDTPFQDYGVNSIMLTQILRRVDAALMEHGKAEAMDPSVFYEHPTLNAFANHLMATWPQALAGAVGGTSAPAPVAAAPVPSAAPAAPAPVVAPPAQPQPAVTPTAAQRAGDFAVIGMACRFPGAPNLDAFWRLLSEGRSAIGPVPAQRWGRATGYRAGLLDNVTDFDPGYFLLGDADARAMDPQALVLLEETLAVLHHAGYTVRDVKGSATGVYIGARSAHRPDAQALAAARNPIVAVGPNYLAANISQFFDLAGPSLVLDTACSSALVGMNMALQALQAGEIGSALVGGISLLQTEAGHQLFDQRKLLCTTDEFHVFDGRSNGVVLGEGAGMVMIKTLERAIEDGDQVLAVIKGLAINNDGRTAGPATPNLAAQKAVMQQALRKAGKAPADIGYIHVNGSGSEVTDLLELKAMEAVYRGEGQGAAIELGSMEPNIGHPLCAKGIAAFIQLALMLSRRRSVPFLSGQQPMAHYDIARSPFYFGRGQSDWSGGAPVAALNCFADGGTNAHVIVEAWNEPPGRPLRRNSLPLPELKRRPIYATATAQDANATDPWNGAGQPEGRKHLTIDHPVLRNHVAYGQQLLPGLAYIDMLYQHFEGLGIPARELELRNLSIYQPLVVAEGLEVLLDIDCTAHADGQHWQVKLEGRERRGAELSEVKRYAVAEMHRAAPTAFADRLDVEQVRREARSTVDLAELYAQCARQGLVHTGMIKAEGRVHETPAATHIEIALGAAALPGTGYRFHPTLIDGSSVGAQRLFAAFFEGEDRLILPLFYESFRASGPLGSACTTRIAASSVRRKNELLYMNLEFFDTHGAKVAELNNYACKLVRDEGAINPGRKQAPAPKAAAAPAASARSVAAVLPAGEDAGALAERYLVELMAARVGTPADQIDTELGYYELGLDSARLLDLVASLEVKIGASLAPTLLFEYTTIAELAVYLAEKYPQAWSAGVATTTQEHEPPPQDLPAQDLAPRQPAPGAIEDIAIIGMAGRYPGADTLEQFWDNLKAGVDCVTEIPASRWERTRLQGVKSPSGKEMSRWGGFINEPECFDAQFFRVSPWEARLLDPQQRQFLEVCWEAIEDAGYTPKNLVEPRGRNARRRVGVYAGVMHNDYALLTAEAVARGEAMPVSLNYAQIANRVSYFCNFHGPSMAIDTVCSSSLIAVHMAMESLRSGECEVALTGGVNLSVHPAKYMTYGMMDMHASDGRCRTFGAGGDGYVSGEGVGTVVLKPLSAAQRDGDHIYAVIKGSVTNHVGAVSGLTVPSPVAQADMIEECLDKTGIHPRSISYVEAHGTGTALGDPIEIQGLVRAFGHYTSDRQYCAIGSVKSNIGHAESAAGISGLTKVALQLRHRTLVPSLHSQELNPHLDFASSPFFVQHACEAWKQPSVPDNGVEVAVPRRAALSSFGASGSNAHLIVEEYTGPQAAAPRTQCRPVAVVLSARKADRLQAAGARLLAHLRRHGVELDLPNLAYTLQVGREAMEERVAFVVTSLAELETQLQDFAAGAVPALRGTVRKGKGSAVAPTEDAQQMAQAWVEGKAVDWAGVHRLAFPDTPPRRVSLPTYPFARERHWLPAPAAAPASPVAPAPALPAPVAAAPAAEVLYFAPRWQDMPLAAGSSAGARRSTVFVIGDAAAAEIVRAAGVASQVLLLEAGADSAANVEQHARRLLAYCQDAERIRLSEPELLVVYAPHHGSDYPYRSLMGALRTIAIELPFVATRLVLDAALAARDGASMQEHLRRELGAGTSHTEVAYPAGGERQVLAQQVLDLAPVAAPVPLAGAIRHQGVYLIAGGLGGLGLMFAEHIGRAGAARIVLTGRSHLDARRKQALDALVAKGVNAVYLPCDTARLDDVRRLVEHVVAEYGALHGVIHSAGVVADNFIPRKTAEEMAGVFAAKVPSIVNLDRATATLALDFFVSFSSSAALGNAGQFDYATANAFLDSFAGERAALALRGERHGKSLSINWPLWKNGGMSVAPAYEKFMRDKFGIVPLEEEPGVRALATALASGEHQFGVFQGERQRIAALLTSAPVRSTAAATVTTSVPAGVVAADTDAAVLAAVG